jgi:hypothetical protein
MFEIDRDRDLHPSNGGAPAQEFLEAENVSLRLLLAQAEIDARGLLAQAGIDAREREAADKLQKLILEELHHRIKNTLATVSAIASRACAMCRVPNMRSMRSKAGYWRWGGRTTCFCRRDGPARISERSCEAPPRLSTIPMCRNFQLPGLMSG